MPTIAIGSAWLPFQTLRGDERWERIVRHPPMGTMAGPSSVSWWRRDRPWHPRLPDLVFAPTVSVASTPSGFSLTFVARRPGRVTSAALGPWVHMSIGDTCAKNVDSRAHCRRRRHPLFAIRWPGDPRQHERCEGCHNSDQLIHDVEAGARRAAVRGLRREMPARAEL